MSVEVDISEEIPDTEDSLVVKKPVNSVSHRSPSFKNIGSCQRESSVYIGAMEYGLLFLLLFYFN